jgi:excisionase family DNA binding protein
VLDVHEAAWLLGAHVETLRRLARRGEIPAYKVGKDWRFSRIEIRGWVKTHHIRASQPLVLVADDDPDIRNLLRLFLEPDGYRVTLAANGAEALDAARRQKPNILLLDLKMRGISGADVLRQLRGLYPDLPVVIVTAYPDSDLMVEALRYPPVTLLPKPVDREVVRGTVRQLLNGSLRDGSKEYQSIEREAAGTDA